MRVLLIKTSSMGDLIHTLPALTDAGNALPDIKFDWVVEDAFAEIPRWHPLVENVIPVSLRKWRKAMLRQDTRLALRELRQQFNQQKYDLVLDAQGLVKSAFLARMANAPRAGLDFKSARESLASFAYQHKYTVNFYQHAVVRMRQLFSLALGYTLPDTPPAFGMDYVSLKREQPERKYIVFLHGTTWTSKQWPEQYWNELAQLVAAQGYAIKISGGSDEEVARAERIAATCSAVETRPRLTIEEMATLLANAAGAVAVDTGFGHLAAAMNLPTISIYGSTNPAFTGALGDASQHLAADFKCAPCLARDCKYRKESTVTPACYATIPPQTVWHALQGQMQATATVST